MRTSWSRVWAYRGFILDSVEREFVLRYRNSMLGMGWAIINPLAMILIYTLVFSRVMHVRLGGAQTPFSYSIFLMAGLLPWGLFTEILNRGQALCLDNANLLKKVYFPKLALLVIIVLSSLLNFIIVFALYLIFLIAINQFPYEQFWAFFLILLLQLWFASTLALILGILNVFFRDIGQIFSIGLQFWFWLTPIVYAIDVLPPDYQALLQLNPMVPIIEAYQDIFLRLQLPQWHSLLPVVILCALLTLIAGRLYRRRAFEMVDEL